MSVSQQIIDQFPSFSAIAAIPEIAALLEKASTEGWTSDYFRSQLWSTDWWKSTPESSRTWQTLKLVDPAQASQQAGTMSSNVIATSTALGLHLTPNEIAWYSELAASGGWDNTQLTRSLIDNTARNRFHEGTVNATRDSLHATAANYGVTMSDQNATTWAQQIATGRQTNEGFEDWARNQAKAAYPSLTKEIDAGLTVKQVADPYMQIAAQQLGLNPETMSLTDPKWQRALQGRDEKGNATGPMTTMDWTRHIMEDPQYDYAHSANGVDASLQLRDSLGKVFGVTA